MSAVSYVDPLHQQEYEYLFKCLLLGDSAVGKSSISERYVDNKFRTNFISTIGVDFKVQSLMWDGKLVKMQLWDTAGQERFRSIVNSYYRGAQGVVLVYDITDPSSAQSIRNWLREIETYAGPNIPIVLVGNKSDAIPSTDSSIIANSRDIIADIMLSYPELTHYECSAKLGHNVEDVFIGLVKALIARRQEKYDPYERESKASSMIKTGQSVSLRPDSEISRNISCCS